MNTQPMRLLFLRSSTAKQRLRPYFAPANIDKTMTAPVTAVVGYDLAFHEHLPRLFPHHPNAKGVFEGKLPLIETTAFRNGRAFLIIAARAFGLDCGPMSGFDNAGLDAEFFAGTQVRSNFLCNLGYGDHSKVFRTLAVPGFRLCFAHPFDCRQRIVADASNTRVSSPASRRSMNMTSISKQQADIRTGANDAIDIDALLQANIVRVFNERNPDKLPSRRPGTQTLTAGLSNQHNRLIYWVYRQTSNPLNGHQKRMSVSVIAPPHNHRFLRYQRRRSGRVVFCVYRRVY